MTGNVKKFISKTGFRSVQLTETLIVDEPYILVTYTIGIGEVPQKTVNFLRQNNKHLIAVAASGNRNWGSNFAKSADVIAEKYNIPLIHKFELAGTNKDIEIFTQEVKRIAEQYPQVDSVK